MNSFADLLIVPTYCFILATPILPLVNLKIFTLAICAFLLSVSGFAQSDEKPNILLIICDDLNRMGYGSVVDPLLVTPNIDSLYNQSIVFENAHANAAGCGPSRASVFSGVLPQTSGHYGYKMGQNSWMDNPYLSGTTSVFRQFKDNGYQVYGSGKVYHAKRIRLEDFDDYYSEPDQGPFGYNKQIHSDFPSIFESYNLSFTPLENIPSYPEYTGWMNKNGTPFFFESDENRDLMGDEMTVAYVDSVLEAYVTGESDEPFFMTAGIYNPHEPFHVPQKYWDLYDPADFDYSFLQPDYEIPVLTSITNRYNSQSGGAYDLMIDLAPEDDTLFYLEPYIHGYYASVSFVDDQIGALLQSLENNGLSENTIVILTSDHGFHLGSKGLVKKSTLWNDATAVPLIFRMPGVAPQVIDDPVSLVDLYPTLLQFSNISPPDSHPLDGRPLQQVVNGAAGTAILSGAARELLDNDEPGKVLHSHHGIMAQKYKYIHYSSGEDELYNIVTDYGETNDLSDDPEFQDIRNALFKLLRQRLGDIRPPLPEYECLYYGDFEQELNGWSVSEPDEDFSIVTGNQAFITRHLVMADDGAGNLKNRNIKIASSGLHRLYLSAYSESDNAELRVSMGANNTTYFNEVFELTSNAERFSFDFVVPSEIPDLGSVVFEMRVLNGQNVHLDDIRVINLDTESSALMACESAQQIPTDELLFSLPVHLLEDFMDQRNVDCSAATGAAEQIWYGFEADTEYGIIACRGISGVDPSVEVFSGCNTDEAAIYCEDIEGSTEYILLEDLVPGEAYRVRITDSSFRPYDLNSPKPIQSLFINAHLAKVDALVLNSQESSGHIALEQNPIFDLYNIDSLRFRIRSESFVESNIKFFTVPFNQNLQIPLESLDGVGTPGSYRISVSYNLVNIPVEIPYGEEKVFNINGSSDIFTPFSVHPNPLNEGQSNLQLSIGGEDSDESGVVSLFDLSSRLVYQTNVSSSGGSIVLRDLPSLSMGSYLVVYQNDHGLVRKELLLIR